MAPSFTKAGLSRLLELRGLRLVVRDPRTPGLLAELRTGGQVTFYVFKRKPGGGPLRVRLGPFPELTVAQARTQAKRVLSDIAQGIDPNIARRDAKREPTVAKLWDAWLAGHAMTHKKESSRKEDERQYNTVLKELHSKKLSSLTTAEVAAWHRKTGKANGPFAANRALALLSTMFNSASLLLGWKGGNPTKGVRHFPEQSRDRFILPDELPKFFAAIDAEPDPWPDYFRVALLTGARRANLMAMAWRDLDLKAMLWRIPAEQMKGREGVTLPLVPEAIEILKRRKEAGTSDEWVFPSSTSKTGHLHEIKSAWKRILKAAKLENLRPHDLRRTLGSWQAGAGVSQAIIGKSLGHQAGSSATAIYSRLSLDPVRAAVTAAAEAMSKAGKAEPAKE